MLLQKKNIGFGGLPSYLLIHFLTGVLEL